MELVHEPGCDLRHTPRQQCNVPGRKRRERLYVWEPEVPLRPGTGASASPSFPFTISRAKVRGAILLELVPVISFVFGLSLWIPALFGYYIGDYPSPVLGVMLISWLIALLAFFFSGTGWMYAGHFRIGATLMVLRGIVVLVTLVSGLAWSLGRGECGRHGCESTSSPAWFMFWLGLSLVAPIASAVSIEITARHDGTAVTPPAEPSDPLIRQLGLVTALELLPVFPGGVFVARTVFMVSGEFGLTSRLWFGPITNLVLGLGFLASGLGWFAVRKVSVAVAIASMRALLLFLLLLATFFTGGCLYRSCDKGVDAFAAAVLIVLGVVAVTVPCASAYFLLTSQIRRANGSVPSPPPP